MATPSLLQIDDRNPLVFYSPNSSWTRGGAASDFDGTSTFTATTGASATLTFTGMPHFMSPSFFKKKSSYSPLKGSEISVWGTIQFLQPNTTTYVVSSYSIDNGSTTIFNATESAGFQFQQKLFQSARLNESISHTIVVTLVNNGTYFIDYFLIVPSDATTSTSASSSATDSSTTAGAVNGSQSHSSRVSLGPVVGGTLGGLALLIIAILAFLLCCKKRRKDKNRMRESNLFSIVCWTCIELFCIIHRRFSGVSWSFSYSRLSAHANATASVSWSLR